MRPSFWIGLVVVVIGVFGCSKGRPLTPAEVAQSERLERTESEQEAPVHVELVQVTYRLEADGTYRKTLRQRYRILNQVGVENWAHSVAYWSPWYMKRPELTATVTNTDAAGKKTVLSLDPATITEQPVRPDAPDIYSDSRMLRAPLPSVSVGSVVEEVIVTATHREFLSKSHMHSVAFQLAVPQDRVELIVDAPSSLEVFFEVRDAKVERSERSAEGRTRTVFVGGPFPALEAPEVLIPSNSVVWPSVEFGTGADWKPLAAEYSGIVDEKLKGIDFSSTVRELIDEGDSDFVKASKLFAWVKSHIRYVGIEFGESGVVPHAPDQTVSRGYGDCKDQATLLVGLLRAAGLPAHLALLKVGSNQDISSKLAAMNVFDHAIVVVPTEQPLWFDPTVDYLPPGFLPSSDQGRLALVASTDTQDLVLTPQATPETNTYQERRVVYLSEHGKARVVETSKGTGVLDAELRSAFVHPPSTIKKNLENYGEQTYYTRELGKVDYGEATDLLQPFEARLEAKESSVGYTEVLDAAVEVREGMLWSFLPWALTNAGEEEERKATLVLPRPYTAELIWEIHPPRGQVPKKLPEEVVLRLGPAMFRRSVRTNAANVVEVTSSFTTGKARFSADDVQEFRQALRKYNQTTVPYVEFQHQAQNLVDANDVPAAIALVRKEVAEHPRDPVARMRMAHLLASYLASAARAEAHRAVALQPDNPLLVRELGEVLSLDPFGVDIEKGFDREGAIQAYQRAHSLDPDDTYSALRAALLLEYDDDARRYQGPSLDEAVAAYDAIPEKTLREYSEGEYANNALFALFWAGHHQPVEERMAKLARDDVPSQLAVMNVAMLHGADAAVRETERLVLSGSERAQALAAAAGALTKKREYGPAAEVLEAALDTSDDVTALRRRLDILRRVRRVEIAALPERTPAELVARLVGAVAAKKQSFQRIARQFFSSRAWADGGKSGVEGTIEAFGGAARSSEVSNDVVADFAVSALETQVEGNDQVGYRVSTKINYGARQGLQLFVVKEGNQYRVRAFGSQLGELGAEALHAIQQGNSKKATQWLDWARESFQAPGGEDPLRLSPFARLYRDGKGDRSLAAAALAATSFHSAQAVPILEAERARVKDETQRQVLDHALVYAYANADQQKKRLELARSLFERLPGSKVAGNLVLSALWAQQRYDEYARHVTEKLERANDKAERISLLNLLSATYRAQNRLRAAREIETRLIDAGDGDAANYNNRAWVGLFLGARQQDLDDARKAVEIDRSLSRLHTLACVYAELGHVSEARQTLQDVVRLRKNRELASVDWFVIGRIAEHLGLPDAARQAYEKVERPELPEATSPYRLTQKRLQSLQR